MSGDRKTPSMGTAIEKITCAICGKNEVPCEHVRVVLDDYPIGVVTSFKPSDRKRERIYELPDRAFAMSSGYSGTAGHIMSVSMVPAPRCEACWQPMKGQHGTTWACTNKSCAEQGKSVETGIGMMMGEVAGG